MKYLLDTNVIIAMFRGKEHVRNAILDAGFENCFISVVTLCEISVGCHYLGYQEHEHEIRFLKDNFQILPVEPYVDTYGEIRAQLIKTGQPIDDFDIIVGATARKDNLILVTHNRRHLDRIEGIQMIDWERQIAIK